jgi:hypothetical protein
VLTTGCHQISSSMSKFLRHAGIPEVSGSEHDLKPERQTQSRD